jgi:hypothetical protein
MLRSFADAPRKISALTHRCVRHRASHARSSAAQDTRCALGISIAKAVVRCSESLAGKGFHGKSGLCFSWSSFDTRTMRATLCGSRCVGRPIFFRACIDSVPTRD